MMTYPILGIDVAKESFDVTLIRDNHKKSKTYKYTRQSLDNLVAWLRARKADNARVFMEATGIYHEDLATFLHDQGFVVHILNPADAAKFAEASRLHKTDKSDSRSLAEFGQFLTGSGRARAWEPEAAEIRALKALIARLDALETDLQREKNRLEKVQVTDVTENIQTSITDMMANLEEAIAKLREDVDDHIDKHPYLKKDRALLQTIPGVGEVVSLRMLLAYHSRSFKKASQFAAYLGLVPRLRESGKHKGKTMLSKRGNAQIRAKLYMAAVVASRYNQDIAAHVERLVKRGKNKKQALGAAMRRLCHICFGVLKHQCEYQPQVALAG